MTQWTELSDSERIEELRRDVLKTMGAVNQLSAHSELVDRTISELVQRIDRLESQAAELESQREVKLRNSAKNRSKKRR
jgi:hypothetical protein